jgi:hypothetical protein
MCGSCLAVVIGRGLKQINLFSWQWQTLYLEGMRKSFRIVLVTAKAASFELLVSKLFVCCTASDWRLK